MHSTFGSVSRRRGFLVPQPPDGTLLSTGTERAEERGCEGKSEDVFRESVVGVAVPGVEGGVKAGERRDGGGRADGCEECVEEVVEAASSSGWVWFESGCDRGGCRLDSASTLDVEFARERYCGCSDSVGVSTGLVRGE